MKPASFAYVRATSVHHALECLRNFDAKLIAGGQSLLPVMNFRLAAPELVIDIDGLTALDRVISTGDGLLIGALTRHERLVHDADVLEHAPLLAEAARHIGHVAIRNRGTIGGSLAHADPTAELPAVCVALGASVLCEKADGSRREIAVDEFLQGLYTTDLAEDEMVTWVRVPAMAPGATWGFREHGPREGDFALAGVCAIVDGRSIRVVVFGVEGRARVFESQVATWLSGEPVRSWVDGLEPLDEPEFRRDVAAAMIRRAVGDAMERGVTHA
jgi:carbon-monoxide dehydrogenase medium subunit